MKAYEKIGQRLQKAREESGMSQEDLAKRLGCSQSSLSYYELGKRRLYFTELQQISNVLNRPLTYFLESADESESNQNDFSNLLKGPYLKEILVQARELKPAQRKSVLEYIQWQKTRNEGEK
jgi:transcriptional regulator with XRE-family HTH domain